MKKQLSLASKRKWVTGGILAFSAVSLLTTGFATWVVGVQRTAQQAGGLGVKVDTASNESVMLTAKADETKKINLVEQVAPTGDLVKFEAGTEFSAVDPHGLEINLTEVKVLFGASLTGNDVPTGVKFSLGTVEGNTVEAEEHKATANLLNEKTIGGIAVAHLRTAERMSYIELNTTLTLAQDFELDSSNTDTTVKVYKIKDDSKTISLSWGKFFDSKSPATYYNDVCGSVIDDGTNAEFSAITGAITKELQDMKTYFDGLADGKIHIAAELVF